MANEHGHGIATYLMGETQHELSCLLMLNSPCEGSRCLCVCDAFRKRFATKCQPRILRTAQKNCGLKASNQSVDCVVQEMSARWLLPQLEPDLGACCRFLRWDGRRTAGMLHLLHGMSTNDGPQDWNLFSFLNIGPETKGSAGLLIFCILSPMHHTTSQAALWVSIRNRIKRALFLFSLDLSRFCRFGAS